MVIKRARSTEDALGARSHARLLAELQLLDPFSFWVIPSSEHTGDVIVAGITGIFLVVPCDLPGAVTSGSGNVRLNGRPVPGLGGMRRRAKALQARLIEASVFTSVDPVLCFTQALAGPPRSARGVRCADVKDVARDLAGRPSTLSPGRAQRAARSLGMQIAGDERRHFSAG